VPLNVFPARAGMNREFCCHRSRRQRVPRSRGDEPPAYNRVFVSGTCSPLARG